MQCVVSVALLFLLFRRLDLSAMRQLYASMPLWFYFFSLGVVVAGQALYAWRWRLLLDAAGVSVSLGMCIRQYFIGIFLNNFFPSTVGGDMAKVFYLGRQHGVEYGVHFAPAQLVEPRPRPESRGDLPCCACRSSTQEVND